MASSRPAGGRPPGRRGGAGSGPFGGSNSTGTGRGTSHNGGCCSRAAAVRSVKRGKFRLAARYARVTPRLLARRLAWNA